MLLRLQKIAPRPDVVSTYERLAVTLRFLATGNSFRSFSFSYRMGRRTISEIVIECCRAIYDVMKPLYMQFPESQDKWRKISNEFWIKWQAPHVIGNNHSIIISYTETFKFLYKCKNKVQWTENM